MSQILFKRIDNSPLIIFRIFFGFLVACESFGAIFTGWVKRVFIDPQFTFSFIGLEWLQPLPGLGMYLYFVLMGFLGISIMLGYRYRFAIISYTLLWAGVYFMQKSSYNNHYYLLLIISFYMIFLPANQYQSLDVKQKRVQESYSMPKWISLLFIFQIGIVYLFAALAKLYPDWLNGSFTKNLLLGTTTNPFFIEIFSQKWFYLFIAYAGIFFDLLIVPLLLFKKTRTLALLVSLIFHLFNAVFLQIGIFPFFALSFALFFYDSSSVKQLFFKRKPTEEMFSEFSVLNSRILVYTIFIPFLFVQLLFPLRHYLIDGDVLWTEEGHRLSWRMMLRERNGYIIIKIKDAVTGKDAVYNYHKNLTQKQINNLATKPDFIWQYCQRIKKEYENQQISIFIDCKNSINRGEYKTLIDPKQDFVTAEWDYFWHNKWIVLH
ncbi:HTTM domain-containing protein [Flavobacterium cucumis]|uniref:Vitamin K-dependent gamma-carboxylase n=1 Tax=Flavobacterium cucumis TaxID=416016 RepID=A0A1M7ZV18_9FLAO|nr:HTTM domain-containing protein [Flavobacterium cucumis]SHO72640.1 Vitamin K-dependent gamma-carboxylase [Flavobacterium cucumis]